MILFSIALLQISNLFQWDSNPIMGLDTICADILRIVKMIGKEFGVRTPFQSFEINVAPLSA